MEQLDINILTEEELYEIWDLKMVGGRLCVNISQGLWRPVALINNA